MKKAIYLLMIIIAGVTFTSCEKDEIGGTATESLAGEWYVTVDAVDDAGNTVYEDFFGLGNTFLFTYNTAADVATEMYVSDQGYFWDYTIKVSCDVDALTFTSNGNVTNMVETDPDDEVEGDEYYCDVNIEDGQVIYGAATTPSGMPADSIVFYVSFSNDTYPAAYGYSKYKVSGYRYTGFTADE